MTPTSGVVSKGAAEPKEKALVIANYEADTSRYLVRISLATSYKGMLTLDGGGTRCILTVMMLRQLENEIKRHLVDNYVVRKRDGEKAVGDAETTADFDIDLADYFEFVAGVSMGSVIAAYIAVKGRGSDKLLELESFRKGCVSFCQEVVDATGNGTTTEDRAGISLDVAKGVVNAKQSELKEKIQKAFPRGSMRRLEIAFRHCTTMFFAYNVEFKASKDGPQNFIEAILGETLASEVKTNLMVSTFDQLTYKGYCFVARPQRYGDAKIFLREEGWLDDGSIWTPGQDNAEHQPTKTEFGGLESPHGSYNRFLDKPAGEPGLVVINRAQQTTSGVATLYLRDLARASSALPNIFDTVVMNIQTAAGSCDDAPEIGTVALTDGASLSNDPTLQALAVQLDPSERRKAKDMAILSVGSGLTNGSAGLEGAAGSDWNNLIGEVKILNQTAFMMQQIETTSKFIPVALAYSLQHEHQYKKGQYTRLQIVSETVDEENALQQLANPALVEDIYNLGKRTIRDSSCEVIKLIEDFVKYYVFGEPQDVYS